MWKVYIFACSVLFTVSATQRVEACQPEPPSIEWISMQDKAANIPINASIWVKRRGSFEPGQKHFTYKLTGPAGELTLKSEGEGQLIRLTPENPFAPNTSYTFSASCTGERCYSGPKEKTATFTTGTEEWKTGKPYQGATRATSSYVKPYKAQHMCEFSHNGYFRLSIGGTSVKHAAYYQLYDVTFPKTVVARWQKPSGLIQVKLNQEGQEKCFYLRAVNHAGHLDDNTTKACVTPTQAKSTERTNEPPDNDAGTADNTPRKDSGFDVRLGCGCHASKGSPPVSIALLVLFLLLGISRRLIAQR